LTFRFSILILFSGGIFLGVVGSFLLWKAASKATSGVPGRFQAAVEILYEMVDTQAKGIIHNAQSRKLVSPLALAVFVWIFLLNSMDFLPVDLFHSFFEVTGVLTAAFIISRVVPTADLSSTLGMSVSVLLICIYYNIKIKGLGGWFHELTTAPFGAHPILWPFNFVFQMIEFVAKTVSHGMRLFGNMYAGELIFMLIALMGGAAAMSLTGILLPHRSRDRWLHLGHLPYLDRSFASFHFHDVDFGLHRVKRTMLIEHLFQFLS
jgi:F-type H+-transporting ATPase subunit a